MSARFALVVVLVFGVCMLGSKPVFGTAQDTPVEEVIVKGDRLQGYIVRLSTEGIELETIYGEGTIKIAYADIERLTTHRPYRLVYDQNKVLEGRLAGIEDATLVVEQSPKIATPVRLDSVQSGVATQDYNDSWYTRFKEDYPEWKAEIDLATSIEQGAVNKRKLDFGLHVERQTELTHYTFDFLGKWETQEREPEPTTTVKDEFRTYLLGTHELAQRTFLFGLPAAERDEPRGIKIRGYPSAGLGYHLRKTDKSDLDVLGGPGVVTTEFTDFGNETYPALLLGFWYERDLPRGSHLDWFTFVMPDITGFSRNWLLRSEARVTVPIVDPIALRFRLTNINDNNPTPDVGNNKFVTALGLVFQL